jgi:hypothetical protein
VVFVESLGGGHGVHVVRRFHRLRVEGLFRLLSIRVCVVPELSIAKVSLPIEKSTRPKLANDEYLACQLISQRKYWLKKDQKNFNKSLGEAIFQIIPL